MRVNISNEWPPDAAYVPHVAPADVAPAVDVHGESSLSADDSDWTLVEYVDEVYDKWITLVRRPGALALA